MNRTAIVSGISTSLAEVLERELDGLTEQIRLFDDLHLDSTSVLELLMALEDAFGIEVDADNLDMETFATIGSLADYVGGRIKS